jgi:hypothetical protein
MRNPWLDLPQQAPYVLADDAAAIERFNRATAARRAADRTWLHLELLPEPFLGDPAAPVVLLSLNFGYSPDDAAWHANPTFAALSHANLEHGPSDYPFYLLDPALDAPGSRWWGRRLGLLVAAASRRLVAGRVLCVEYFGYHSVGFGRERLRVPSQEHGFHLVRQALARDAVVVLTRSHRLWVDAVPELATYPRLFPLRSEQNTTVSRRNCPDGFEEIVRALTTPP